MRSLRTTTKNSPHSLQLEKARVQQRRPNAAKNKTKQTNKQKTACETQNHVGVREEYLGKTDLSCKLYLLWWVASGNLLNLL